MTDITRRHMGPRMSESVVHQGVVYLAGQVAEDTSLDVAGQTAQVLSAIDRLLAEVGSDKTRILSATIFLSDIATFAEMNKVWDTWVPQGHTPARATVEARLAAPGYKVEIKIVAACAA
jgi:enamine deaminase RidA (YjgF/YER057c/UK114 family)